MYFFSVLKIYNDLYPLDFLDLWRYLGNKKSYQISTGVKTTGFSKGFTDFQKEMIFNFYFWLNLGNEESYRRPAGVKTTRFSGGFSYFF